VTQTSYVSTGEAPDREPSLLDQERVRDQISAAEELHHLGHAEPALVAAGAALAGALRLRAGALVGRSASRGALLEALHATGVVSVSEHEMLARLLRVHDRLMRGYAPDRGTTLARSETGAALATIVHLVEPLHSGALG
jgi:hypothetical protein